ncbi:MAG: laccase domain-containing protein [bacterium]
MHPLYHVSHRSAGNMSYHLGDEKETSANRTAFIALQKVPAEQVVAAHLSGNRRVHEVGRHQWGAGVFKAEDAVPADILVSKDPETFLFINVADCLALGFFDRENHICALTHAGYRGVSRHMPRQTVEWMVDHYGSNPQKIHVRVSPAIHKECYAFPDRTLFRATAWDEYLYPALGGGFHADWIRFALDELAKCGIHSRNIQQSHFNTYTNHYFYSHQRQIEQKALEEPEKGNYGVLAGWE